MYETFKIESLLHEIEVGKNSEAALELLSDFFEAEYKEVLQKIEDGGNEEILQAAAFYKALKRLESKLYLKIKGGADAERRLKADE